MGVKSQGRGAAAALGLFLLFAGLVGGGVLYFVAQQRPGQSVDGFARAPVGCTTTLEFTETGVFYVFEEVGFLAGNVGGGCQPVADPTAAFGVEFSGDLLPASVTVDDSVSYDVDGFDGRSIQRIEIADPGQYTVVVTGSDLTVLAALGRDPDDGVDDLRRTASIVAIGGVVLGLLLLVLAGRRSKRAALVTTPDGPGWGPAVRTDGAWPPEAPRLDQVPVNPHQPTEPARATQPGHSDAPRVAPTWGPPVGPANDELPAPPAPPPPTITADPVLPDHPGKVSGT
jgi:hypothetical protein